MKKMTMTQKELFLIYVSSIDMSSGYNQASGYKRKNSNESLKVYRTKTHFGYFQSE